MRRMIGLCMVTLLFSATVAHSKEVTLLLIRHGETDWNAERRVQGHTDIPLNVEGERQALEIAETITATHPDLSAIYASDLSRAYRTADITAKKFNLPVIKRSSLREICAGASEGMLVEEKISLYQEKWEELRNKYPDKRERWKHCVVPGEESVASLIERIKGELLAISKEANDRDKIAVFFHGRAMQVFLADVEDKNFEEIKISNCAMVQVRYNSEDPLHPFQFIE